MDELALFKSAIELGVVGLMFVMWWLERKDRIGSEKREDVFKNLVIRAENREEEVINVIKENTKAITTLTGIIDHDSRSRTERLHQRQ